jgi:hypothetical protein
MRELPSLWHQDVVFREDGGLLDVEAQGALVGAQTAVLVVFQPLPWASGSALVRRMIRSARR